MISQENNVTIQSDFSKLKEDLVSYFYCTSLTSKGNTRRSAPTSLDVHDSQIQTINCVHPKHKHSV